MDWWLYFMVVFGFTNALTLLHVGHPIRKLISGIDDDEFEKLASSDIGLVGFRQAWLGRVVRCHACAGYWIGVGVYVGMHIALNRTPFTAFLLIESLLAASAASAFNFMIGFAIKAIGTEKL